MIKLVASDLDGTLLLNGAQSLPEELFPLIKELKELGILFVAASGRQYANMKRMFAPVVDDMAFIAENGGLAIQNEKVLYQDSFPKELVREIVEAIYDKKDADFTCSTKDFYYIRPKTEHYRDLMLNVVKNNCKEIDSFDEITEPCMKVAVYEREGIQEDSIRYWKERFGDRCTVVTSGFAWVDFIPFETNKAKGLRNIRNCLVSDRKNVLCLVMSIMTLRCWNPYHTVLPWLTRSRGQKAASYQTERVEYILKKLIRAGGNIEEVIK